MSKNTAVAERDASTELSTADQIAEQIRAQQEDEFGDDLLSTPILKIGQSLTREVKDGNAEAGEFINTLTNDSLGTKVEFIVAYYNKGRFASEDKTGRAFVAFGPTIPANWEPLVGPEFVGTPFSEYPEAEEAFKAAVNAKQREWGKGPLVSTTHNFTGLVLTEIGDGEVEPQPVRLSLKRIDVPAARKITTLQRAVLRNKAPWDKVISLSTTERDFGRNSAFLVNAQDIRFVRDTTADERELAAQVALAASSGRTSTNEDALEERPTEPAADGGLAV